MLGLRGVVHVVGGPDVLHGRVLAALLRPEERVLQHPAHDAQRVVAVGQRSRERRFETQVANDVASTTDSF